MATTPPLEAATEAPLFAEMRLSREVREAFLAFCDASFTGNGAVDVWRAISEFKDAGSGVIEARSVLDKVRSFYHGILCPFHVCILRSRHRLERISKRS